MVAVFPVALLSLLFLFAVVIVIAVVVGTARARRRVSTPSCGSCGYAVEGLEVLRCPECGSDLRSVGIVTPHMARGMRPVTLAMLLGLAWTFFLPLPASIVTMLAYRAIPKRFDNSNLLTLGAAPGSGTPGVTVDFSGYGPTPNTSIQTARAHLDFEDGTRSQPLVVDVASGTCTVMDEGTGTRGSERELSSVALLDWMQASGVDPTRPLVRTQADDLLKNLRSVPAGRGANTGGGYQSVSQSSSVTPVRNKWFAPIAWTSVGLAWILGLLVILRRWLRENQKPSSGAA